MTGIAKANGHAVSKLADDGRLQYIIGNPSCVYWEGERVATRVAADVLICLILHEGRCIPADYFLKRIDCDLYTLTVLIARVRARLRGLGAGFSISNKDRTANGWRLVRSDWEMIGRKRHGKENI